jgi:hypothetical protein
MKTDIVVMGMGGHLMDGCMTKMRRQILIIGRSWGEDEYAYHMKSFIQVFGDTSEGWKRNLHKWLFE